MRSHTIFWFMLTALVFAACSHGGRLVPELLDGKATPLDADPDFLEGKSLLAAGHPARAIAELRKALIRKGRDVRTLNAMAIAYAELGRHGLSVRYFHEALALDPHDPTTLNNIGYAALRRGETRLAGRYLAKARAHASSDRAIARNLADLAAFEGATALFGLMRQESPAPNRMIKPAVATVARIDDRRQRLQPVDAFDRLPAVPVPRLKPVSLAMALPGQSGCVLSVPVEGGRVDNRLM